MKITNVCLLAALLITGIANATPTFETPIEDRVREFNSKMLPKAANVLEALRARLGDPKDPQLRRFIQELTSTLARVRVEGSALESSLVENKTEDIAARYYQVEIGAEQFRDWIDRCVIRAAAKGTLKVDEALLAILEDFWAHEGSYRFDFRREADRLKEKPNQSSQPTPPSRRG